MNEYQKYNRNYYYQQPAKYSYIKLWVLGIILLTIVYFIYYYCIYDSYTLSFYDGNKLNYLRSMTPAHPPPLVNFMDPPSVFNTKYVNIKELTSN